MKHSWILAIALVLLMACAPRPTGTTAPRVTPITTAVSGLQMADGYTATLYAEGLNGPTALAFGPPPDPLTGGSQRLYVAQLNGGENDVRGQVVAIDPVRNAQEIVLDNLQKPTGLAWFNDALYVVSYRDVLMFTARDGRLDGPKALVTGVRFNGRSLGHIKVGPTPDPFTGESEPRLYFHSSGGDPAVSGYIYSMRLDGSDQRIVARGLKNGYAFTWALTDGTMYATEIGDNIAGAPVEEVNVIRDGADYGWPRCPGDTQCDGVPSPLATFPPNATPTGITWWEDSLIVTLWGPADPHVARITLDAQGRAAGVSDFTRGLQNPMDVIFTRQGTLLLLDFAGKIWEVRKDLPEDVQNISPPQPSPTPTP